MLWISPFGVWPSSQNLELFYGYRRSFGEVRSLSEAPYHRYGAADSLVIECLIDMILYFVWDAILIDTQNRTAVQFSHDEWLAVGSDSNLNPTGLFGSLSRSRILES